MTIKDPQTLALDKELEAQRAPLTADLWDLDNPHSVINLAPDVIRGPLAEALEKRPDFFGHDQQELWMLLTKQRMQPTTTDNRIRLSFWNEYERTITNGNKEMKVSNIVAGVCSSDFFYKNYLKNAGKVAWMLTIPASYELVLDESLTFGLEEMRKILEYPDRDRKGNLIIPLLTLKTKIWALMDLRKNGAATQRIENKSLSVNVNTNDKQVAGALVQGSMESLQKKLEELRKRDRLAPPSQPAAPVDIVIEQTNETTIEVVSEQGSNQERA